MHRSYENSGGHLIIPAPYDPLTLYTESEMDCINPGQIVRADDGSKHTVIEIRHISGKLYRVVLFPVKEV